MTREKLWKLSETKVLGYEIKLRKLKGKEVKKDMQTSCRIAYIDFKSQAGAERALDEKQGTKIGGLAIVLGHVEEKSQGQEGRDEKPSTWRSKGCYSSVDLRLARVVSRVPQRGASRRMGKLPYNVSLYQKCVSHSPIKQMSSVLVNYNHEVCKNMAL